MSDSTPPPTITALPDIQASPTDPKKSKLFHVSSTDDTVSLTSDDLSLQNGHGGPACEDDADGEAKEDGTPITMAVPLPTDEGLIETEEWWELKMSWSGKIYEVKVASNDMVYDFREQIQTLTAVPPVRQKLIGLTKGKLSAELDSTRFGTLGIKKGIKFTMIGTPEELSFKDPNDLVLPEIVDDFDVEYSSQMTKKAKNAIAPADDPRNKRKIQEKVETCPISVINEPRPGKKLLVLDLDYTIVDTKPLIAGSLPPSECARPGLHEFLELVYQHYDIAIWSQTHWRWLEMKLVELGMLGGMRNYKLCFIADRTSMFPVFTERNGQPYQHEVKPLAYFWAKFPHWSAKNTIHIDDLSRNFALNPGEGLRIRAFNTAGTATGWQDRELAKLGVYLWNLATMPEGDFTKVDHGQWRKSPLRRQAIVPDATPVLPETDA
ncbi:HAD-like domain-containing protein [Papiliotrema laurentii]|uniref:protein-serine/threonine phosphatase n=1 Tax=Papiliotrema laurentii TaxID=5418 RepID=A0AAD9FSQ7_PAPLA|nr:HAD-like domain-containing protein [Papiliotrema laurentii]